MYTKLKEHIQTRLRAGLFINVTNRLNSYQLILTNSHFTCDNVYKFWRRKGLVLHPPVYLIPPHTDPKKNIICSIGRFFTLGHGKKQEILIEAFKMLIRNGLKDWELHLVGGIGTEPTSVEYKKKLMQISKGYPIHFHFNATRNLVEKYLNESKIYWHAAGYGEDEKKNPVRFEHFGIAPVEAISAGCVPILYDGGGLPEIIRILQLDPEKHIFSSIDELVSKTGDIMQNYLEYRAILSSVRGLLESNFSMEVFSERLLKILDL